MPGKKRLRSRSSYTKALHAQRMGDEPKPTMAQILARDRQLREEVRQIVARAARKAEKRARRIERDI